MIEVWKPTPKQEIALRQSPKEIYEIGYGGARGGGKTDAGIVWMGYDIEHSKLRGLVIRRNAEDLKDWIDRAEQAFKSDGAVKTGTPGDFHFPSGAVIRTGHLKDENAYSKYVGHEYHRMLIEELNLIPSEDSYLKLISSCRSTITELPPQVFSTFNPSDAGFAWIKKRFNIHGTPIDPIYTTDRVTGLKRVFVPARLEDNPFLNKDQTYYSFLKGLPDGLRQAWLHGSWEDPIVQGAYYTAELEQAKNEGRITRIVPYDPRLLTHTVWDIGMDDFTCIGFWQRTANDIRCINYYQNNEQGLDHYLAKLEEYQRTSSYRFGSHYLPHDANKRELATGQTVVDVARKAGFKFTVLPKENNIMDGILRVKMMFPRIFIHGETCQPLTDALRNYRKEWDENLLKYKDSPVHDWSSHASDMLRYTSMVENKMINEEEDNSRLVWDSPNADPYRR